MALTKEQLEDLSARAKASTNLATTDIYKIDWVNLTILIVILSIILVAIFILIKNNSSKIKFFLTSKEKINQRWILISILCVVFLAVYFIFNASPVLQNNLNYKFFHFLHNRVIMNN